jgi:DNA-binding NtrC family response regulator
MAITLLSKDEIPLTEIGRRLTEDGVLDVSCVSVSLVLNRTHTVAASDLVILISNTDDVVTAGGLTERVRKVLGPEPELVLCMQRPSKFSPLLQSGASEIIIPRGQTLERIVERILGHVIRTRRIDRFQYESLWGATKKMQEVYDKLTRYAELNLSVLLLGETGTGKGLAAEVLHAKSNKPGRQILINSAAITPELIGSELFGHKRGTFTSAVADRKGHIEAGQDGSVFFDEIGDLSLALQAVLLDVVENNRIMPVGTNEYKRVNSRFIFATNCDLVTLMEEKQFRSDLFERIKQLVLKLPPLRDRMADIPLLVDHFLKCFNEENHKGVALRPGAIDELFRYEWPRNVRELNNVVRQAAADVGGDGMITDILFREGIRAGKSCSNGTGPDLFRGSWAEAKDRFEAEYFKRLHANTSGDIPKMIELSGQVRSRVFDKMRKYGISARSKPSDPQPD